MRRTTGRTAFATLRTGAVQPGLADAALSVPGAGQSSLTSQHVPDDTRCGWSRASHRTLALGRAA